MLLLSLPAPITPFADFASSRRDLGHFHGQQRRSNLPPGCKGLKKYNITSTFMYVRIRFLSATNMSCDILQQDTNTVCINFCLELFHRDCDLTRGVLNDVVYDDAIKICLEKTGPESNVIGDALFEKFFFHWRRLIM